MWRRWVEVERCDGRRGCWCRWVGGCKTVAGGGGWMGEKGGWG